MKIHNEPGHHQREHPHRAGVFDWIVFLISGPETSLEKFGHYAGVEIFDRRGQTLRCRAHSNGTDRGQAAYGRALKAAKSRDVTMQDLCETGKTENGKSHLLRNGATVTVSDCIEEYPIVNLGSHGMKWPSNK